VLLKNTSQISQHLSYCSNIHPGESWKQTMSNLQNNLPGIRDQIAPEQDFGIGLRLSAQAASELNGPETLSEFQSFLSDNPFYLFTINGFPYGPFHGTTVKESVYLPDWLDPERLRYTNELADILAILLRDGVNGSISTICLALEPEPCCFIETIEETCRFFGDYLYSESARMQLSKLTGLDDNQCEQALHTHLTVCLDICHAAVEYEDAKTCLQQLQQAECAVGKLQISAGLRFDRVNQKTVELLKPFEDNVYLHQVVAKQGTKLHRFTDLHEAFASINSGATHDEWRVHFHVPIFMDDFGDYQSTQFFIKDMLQLHKTNPISHHLEVETYTWGVLPDEFKSDNMQDAIIRELQWVMTQLN